MFRSYEPGQSDKVDLIMDVIPGEEPSSGPNYFNFDPSVLYTFNVDNDRDGLADDVKFELSFQNRAARRHDRARAAARVHGDPADHDTSTARAPRGSASARRYTLTMVKGKKRTVLADGLFAVPSNVGPRTMPNYQQLVDEGIYTLDGGIRVFAGQRDDPFYIDLGAVFDTLNLRSPGTDMLSGFNVHTIALEVPSTLLTGDTRDDDARRVREHEPAEDQRPGQGRRQGQVGAGAAARQPARQRGDHRTAGQGPLERDRAQGRVQVPASTT